MGKTAAGGVPAGTARQLNPRRWVAPEEIGRGAVEHLGKGLEHCLGVAHEPALQLRYHAVRHAELFSKALSSVAPVSPPLPDENEAAAMAVGETWSLQPLLALPV